MPEFKRRVKPFVVEGYRFIDQRAVDDDARRIAMAAGIRIIKENLSALGRHGDALCSGQVASNPDFQRKLRKARALDPTLSIDRYVKEVYTVDEDLDWEDDPRGYSLAFCIRDIDSGDWVGSLGLYNGQLLREWPAGRQERKRKPHPKVAGRGEMTDLEPRGDLLLSFMISPFLPASPTGGDYYPWMGRVLRFILQHEFTLGTGQVMHIPQLRFSIAHKSHQWPTELGFLSDFTRGDGLLIETYTNPDTKWGPGKEVLRSIIGRKPEREVGVRD